MERKNRYSPPWKLRYPLKISAWKMICFLLKWFPFFLGWRIREHFQEGTPFSMWITSQRANKNISAACTNAKIDCFFGGQHIDPWRKMHWRKMPLSWRKGRQRSMLSWEEKMLNSCWIFTWCGFIHTEGRKITTPMGTKSKRNFRRWCKGPLYFHYTGCLIGSL